MRKLIIIAISAMAANSRMNVATAKWREENKVSDWEVGEIGVFLCNYSSRDIALMLVRLQEASRWLLEAASRSAFHDNTIIRPEPNFGEADDDMSLDGGSTPLTFGHLRRLYAALDATPSLTDDFIDAATLDAHIAAQPKDWMKK